MDYGDTMMHGLEASSSVWLQNHARWGRYLALALPEVDTGEGNAAVRGGFFLGSLLMWHRILDSPRGRGSLATFLIQPSSLHTSSNSMLIPLLCSFNIIHFVIKPQFSSCYYVLSPANIMGNKANKALPSQNQNSPE